MDPSRRGGYRRSRKCSKRTRMDPKQTKTVQKVQKSTKKRGASGFPKDFLGGPSLLSALGWDYGMFCVPVGPFSILKASNHNASTRRIHPRSPEDSMNFLQLFLFLGIPFIYGFPTHGLGPWALPMALPMGHAHGPCPWNVT